MPSFLHHYSNAGLVYHDPLHSGRSHILGAHTLACSSLHTVKLAIWLAHRSLSPHTSLRERAHNLHSRRPFRMLCPRQGLHASVCRGDASSHRRLRLSRTACTATPRYSGFVQAFSTAFRSPHATEKASVCICSQFSQARFGLRMWAGHIELSDIFCSALGYWAD